MTTNASLRGSRKHVYEWIRIPTFREELNELIRPCGVVVRPSDHILPTGEDGKRGLREARLETFLAEVPMRSDLQKWWLATPGRGNTPNWDLAAHATLNGKPALVLVEAKANVEELSHAGKSKPSGTKPKGSPPGAPKRPPSADSWQNHEHIGAAIMTASEALGRKANGFSLSRDSHYQFANRVAFAWKLASMGLPTVLIYLGFTGDQGITDAGQPLQDAESWESLLRGHVKGQVPDDFFGRWVKVGESGFYPMIAARVRAKDSPIKVPRPRG